MTGRLVDDPISVPISGRQSVEIQPLQPWPSAYRGSRYSIVNASEYGGPEDVTLNWSHRDMEIFASPPDGLHSAMSRAGKAGGKGSFRITAESGVITKVPADSYDNLDQAPVSEGWIPVYLGRFEGELAFDDVTLDPSPPTGEVGVWQGLSFDHGERWSVTADGRLVWRWKDYEFPSVAAHPELIAAYSSYRSNGGRLYVTEYGHVWGNASLTDGPTASRSTLREAVQSWKETAEREGDVASLRLVNRRMTATGGGDPAEGLVPIHLGHVNQFDGGVVPTPVVEEESYYAVVGQYEQVWE